MNPQKFGWQHLTYLAVFVVLMVVSLILIKLYAKSEKAKLIIVKVVAALLFIFVLWNRIAITVSNQRWTNMIPNSFCGMSSFVLSLACLFGKKNNEVLHFVYYLSVVGGFIVMIFPDFIESYSSFFHSITISGLLHHTFSFYLCVLLLVIGYFTPNYRKWKNLVIGFMAYITLGAFQISVFGYDDAFYIINPVIPGTPLTVWLIAVIFGVGYILLMVVYEAVRRKLANKKTAKIVALEEAHQSSTEKTENKVIEIPDKDNK